MSAAEKKAVGNSYFQNGEFAKAVEAFSEAIKVDSEDNVLYSNRSGAYASLHKYMEALDDGDKCIRLKPDWAKGYSRKGLALHNLGRSQEAEDAYQKGLKIDPNNTGLKDGLKNVQDGKKSTEYLQAMLAVLQAVQSNEKLKQYSQDDPQYIEKLTNIIRTIKTNPQSITTVLSDPDPRLREGLMAALGVGMKDGEDDESPFHPPPKKEDKEKEPELSPIEKDAQEWKEKANKLYKAREFDAALEAYDKALEINPDEILFHTNKGAVYIEKGEYEKCIAECQKALDRRCEVKASYSKVSKVYNRLAVCYTKMRNFDKAMEMYEKSLLEDNNRHTRAALKDLQRQKEKDEREAYYDSDLAEKHRELGNECFKAGDYPQAKKEYDEAIRRKARDTKLYGNRAMALTKLGEFPSALKDCDMALDLDPNFVKCWIRKGNIHFMMKENHRAMEAYTKALKLDPENTEARDGKFKVLMKIQEISKSTEVDEEQYRHAVADPEIQQILGDPQFNLILKKITETPSSLADYMQDPKIAAGISKLMSAGILRTA